MGVTSLGAEFWTPAFGFLTAVVGCVRWLIRVYYVGKQRTNIHKANLDMTVEKFKATEAGKFVLEIKLALDNLHETVRQNALRSEEGLTEARNLAASFNEKMDAMQVHYTNFNTKTSNIQAGGQLISSRIEKLETEIKTLKVGSPNVFVTTKKPEDSNGR